MCSFMRNISRWTGFPACWMIHLKSAPINYKLMNDHFSVSVLVDTTCSHNWIAGDGGWFLRRDHRSYSGACAVALKGNACGIATFLYLTWRVPMCTACSGVGCTHFSADLHCLVIQSLCPALPGSLFFSGPSFGICKPVIPKHSTAHVTRVQMKIEFPEDNRMSTSFDIPRRHCRAA